MFAAGLGAAAAAGGAITGWLYDVSAGVLVTTVVGIQLFALAVAIAFGVCSAGDVARLSPRGNPSDRSG